jgi:hypothetical protein
MRRAGLEEGPDINYGRVTTIINARFFLKAVGIVDGAFHAAERNEKITVELPSVDHAGVQVHDLKWQKDAMVFSDNGHQAHKVPSPLHRLASPWTIHPPERDVPQQFSGRRLKSPIGWKDHLYSRCANMSRGP